METFENVLNVFNNAMAHILAMGGLIGLGVFVTRCADWHREQKVKDAVAEMNRKRTAELYRRSTAGGWVVLLLLFFVGCGAQDVRSVTGKLVGRERTNKINGEYSLKFEDKTEWVVIDCGGFPWPMGREVRVECQQHDGRAYVVNVYAVDPPPGTPTKTPDEPFKSPTGKQKKVLFSGQTQMGELVVYENEYSHNYLSDFQVQTEGDSVTITRKVKK